MISIGSKIKQLREERGITQTKLAEMINLSYQQIQKYENGKSQISVNKLIEISKALGVHISIFLKKQDNQMISEPSSEEYTIYNGFNYNLTEEEIALLEYFRQIKNPKVRRSLLKQLKGIIEY